MDGRALVVHATDVLLRGFHTAATDMQAPDGTPTNALHALTGGLRRALAFKIPDRAVAVLQAGELDGPDLLIAQTPRLPSLIETHGIQVVTSADAAQTVASYVRQAVEAGLDVVVVGGDKRLAQLVGERVWWYEPFKDVRYTPEIVRKRFEVLPEKVSEWLALVGDDGVLPGVKGIGKKGATSLIETYGDVPTALESIDEIKGRTGNALRAAGERVNVELARAHLDVDRALPVPWEDLAFWPIDSEALNALYGELGFFSMLAAEESSTEIVRCEDRASVEAFLGALEGPVAVYPLITDPSPPRGRLVGLALSAGDGRAAWIAVAHIAALQSWLEDAESPKLGHDLKAASVALLREGIALRGIVGDTCCASHLAEPSRMAPHDLDRVAPAVLRRALATEDSIRGVGRRRKDWDRLPDKGPAFAAERADVIARVWARMSVTAPDALMEEYLALSQTLIGMEQRGFACDADDLRKAAEDFTEMRESLEAEIFEMAGRTLNLGSTKQLGTLLFEELGLEVVARTKTGWSTATHALERIAATHPIVPRVIRWRRLRRLQDTWITSLIRDIDEDGRVRSTFHPARSFSGRLVNSHPDLGRVPAATPEMMRIRHAFIAPPGRLLLSVDYNQLGLYVLAHLTGDPALVEPLQTGDDMHTLTAAAVLDIPRDRVGIDQRQLGKVVNFATFAGQGASALAMQLRVDAKEAKLLIARFDKRYAVVRTFQDEQLKLAQERGWIQTIAGRPWPIGDLKSLDPQLRSYAERLARRATHEASVADVTRRGLLDADLALQKAGLDAFPLLQIHDEVLFEVREDQLEDAARVAGKAMCDAFALRVPMEVGCKAGPNWAELKRLR